MITPELLLEAVADVARVAGEVALRHFKTGIDVDTKGDGSPVTVADRTAEHIAREWIAARFPGDAVLGEEYGLTGDVRQRRWLIDPIDGTKTFVRGVPLWGWVQWLDFAAWDNSARSFTLAAILVRVCSTLKHL